MDSSSMSLELQNGIAFLYLQMDEGKECEDALSAMMSTPCLSLGEKEGIISLIDDGEPYLPCHEDYDFYSYQDGLIDEVIKNREELDPDDFRGQIYDEIIAFIENPLFPFDHPTCYSGIREDIDDYTSEYVFELRDKK